MPRRPPPGPPGPPGPPRPPGGGAGGAAFSSVPPSGMAVWMKIESPHTTGDAVPRPGIFTFHLTFLSSDHVVGGSALGENPLASGPRHAGQFDSAADVGFVV